MKNYSLLAILFPALLAACSGNEGHYQTEEFSSNPSHRRNFSVPAEALCSAVRRTLLGDGYLLENTSQGAPVAILASKEYQDEEKQHSVLRMQVFCETSHSGSTLFVTAIESHYDVKSNRQSSGFGIPLVGPITLETKSESENLIKTGGKSINDRRFYERFFKALQSELQAARQ